MFAFMLPRAASTLPRLRPAAALRLAVAGLILACIALPARHALAQTGGGSPVVVHDTRAIATTGAWDAEGNSYIGGAGSYGNGLINHDIQDAELFTLAARTRLTRITIDALALPLPAGGGIPAGGFLVEVFANLPGNHPAESPVFAVAAPPGACVLEGTFPPSGTFAFGGDRGTWGIDLTAGNVVLDPGAWWISVAARNDGEPTSGTFRPVAVNARLGPAPTHFRCGGIDHGTNYPCPLASTNHRPDWSPHPSDLISFLPGTLSMRIDGVTQTGGSVACAADFNASGRLDAQDIFDFLAAWFAGDPRSDFNHTDGIGVQDIFDFLTAWFGEC